MIVLRAATVDDAPLLRQWDDEPDVAASDPSDGWDWDIELARTPPWRQQLMAEVNGRPIGMVQIIDPEVEETHYWGDCGPHLRAIDIWIGEEQDRGQGYGTAMMIESLRLCFAEPTVTAVIIDPLLSNTRAIAFYQRLGFQPVERRIFGDDECWVHRIERADFERTLSLRKS